jgi:hypothetical protein
VRLNAIVEDASAAASSAAASWPGAAQFDEDEVAARRGATLSVAATAPVLRRQRLPCRSAYSVHPDLQSVSVISHSG